MASSKVISVKLKLQAVLCCNFNINFYGNHGQFVLYF